ncbi:hypothetical protein F503_03730 [Ophiostoma piceae UAMH 11346]|uniref:Uncharacterized protein n=1 Tax=Ophiostoma piceae (strain UAMH 11346) TaxID=1262450 RepID=S3CWF8_OPHP1|nr:hypothetical protein F503_03730 [Ophiostoma piceae UAMH 11346]
MSQTANTMPTSQPQDAEPPKTWSQSARDSYDALYTSWAPWAEDLYLRYFTRHNKASYATEDALQKTKVTGVAQVDALQDGVGALVGGQVGQGGLLQPVGDVVSKHGINRAERDGQDEGGAYVPQSVSKAGSAVASGGTSAAGTVGGGLQSGVQTVGHGIGLFAKN